MVQATIQNRVTREEVKTFIEVTRQNVLIELTPYEATTLLRIVGTIGGVGPRREVASDLYRALLPHLSPDEPSAPKMVQSNYFVGEV